MHPDNAKTLVDAQGLQILVFHLCLAHLPAAPATSSSLAVANAGPAPAGDGKDAASLEPGAPNGPSVQAPPDGPRNGKCMG